MSKVNPNKVPCSKEQSDRLSDEAFYTSVICTMSTVVETDRFSTDEVQKIWNSVNDTSDKIAGSDKASFVKGIADFETKYGITCPSIKSCKVDTLAKARKLAKVSFGIACALILSEVSKLNVFSPEEIRELWDRTQYKYDSVKKKYAKVSDMSKALEEEYSIHIRMIQ